MIIPRGCTPIHYFEFPYSADEIDVLYITYQQNGETVLEKTKEDCVFTEGYIHTQLSQEDTLVFAERAKVSVQIRYRLSTGKTGKSAVMYATTDELLKDGVI